jgi:tRNA modification GTPase
MKQSSTIFALSSGAVPSGVAVVRVSGPMASRAVELLCGEVPPARSLALRTFRDETGDVLDRGLVAFFPAPHSFTGEDCAEFHLHGSRAVIAVVLERLGTVLDCRHAEAGEFTKRAFINGKLDLTAAEGLGDLILAETEAQRRLAQANAEGGQRRLYDGWRARLLHSRAMIEAELDFSDEGDVPGLVAVSVWTDMRRLRGEMAQHLARFRSGEIVREGFKVAIVGAPNAGKSSLLNFLAGRDVAIVSDEPGTTRDVLEVALDLEGAKVVLYDTAGIREAADRVEAAGIERARRAAEQSDLVLLLEDLAAPVPVTALPVKPAIQVGTKADLAATGGSAGRHDLVVSTVDGMGIDQLLTEIGRRANEQMSAVSEGVVPTRQRHVELIRRAIDGLDEALGDGLPLELRAEGLRVAGDEIGRLSGAVGAEEVLGVIFSAFCIGK